MTTSSHERSIYTVLRLCAAQFCVCISFIRTHIESSSYTQITFTHTPNLIHPHTHIRILSFFLFIHAQIYFPLHSHTYRNQLLHTHYIHTPIKSISSTHKYAYTKSLPFSPIHRNMSCFIHTHIESSSYTHITFTHTSNPIYPHSYP